MDFNFGTWNVKTLYKPGTESNLIRELARYKIELAAIQETKWQRSGIRDTKMHTILYSNKEEGNRELEVAFIVKNTMKSNIIDFRAVKDMHPPNKNKIF